MTWRRKVDTPHQAIVKALRQVGVTVVDTSRCPGFVDLVCWTPKSGFILIEVKRNAKAPLTDSQLALARSMPFFIVWTVHGALELFDIEMQEEKPVARVEPGATLRRTGSTASSNGR